MFENNAKKDGDEEECRKLSIPEQSALLHKKYLANDFLKLEVILQYYNVTIYFLSC